MLIDGLIKIIAFFVGLIPHWTVVVDVETTSKYPEDTELLQVTLLSGSGRVLFNKYIKPDQRTEWKGAQKVNHISCRRVKHCRHFSSYVPLVNAYLRHTKRLVGYNLKGFDFPILSRYGVYTDAKLVDIMLDDAQKRTKPGEREARWRKLKVVARKYGYIFRPHDSVEDCMATQHINVLMHPGINTIFFFLRKFARYLAGAICILIAYKTEMQAFEINEYSGNAIVGVLVACWSYLYGPIAGAISVLAGMISAEAKSYEIVEMVSLAIILGTLYNYAKPSLPIFLRSVCCAFITIVVGVLVWVIEPGLLSNVISCQLLENETIISNVCLLICGIPLYFIANRFLPRIL